MPIRVNRIFYQVRRSGHTGYGRQERKTGALAQTGDCRIQDYAIILLDIDRTILSDGEVIGLPNSQKNLAIVKCLEAGARTGKTGMRIREVTCNNGSCVRASCNDRFWWLVHRAVRRARVVSSFTMFQLPSGHCDQLRIVCDFNIAFFSK